MMGKEKCNGKHSMSTMKEIKKHVRIFKEVPDTSDRLGNNQVAVVRNVVREDIERFHGALGINATCDWVDGVDELPAYVVYKDETGTIHQMYSLVKEDTSDEVEKNQVLPDYISRWIDRTKTREENDWNNIEMLVQEQCKSIAFEQGNLDYYDSGKAPKEKNIYTSTYRFFAVHSNNDGTDYYFVRHEGIYAFENLCVDVYKKSVDYALSKIQEYYGGIISEKCDPELPEEQLNTEHFHIMQPSPQTSQGEESITVGMDWNLGGNVSYSGKDGAAAAIEGGINVSNSKTYTVPDVNVIAKFENQCAAWTYEFKKADCHFNFFSYGQVELDECATSATASFLTENEWIWHCESSSDLAIKATIDVTLISSRARLTAPGYTACDEKTKKVTQTLNMSIAKPPVIQTT